MKKSLQQLKKILGEVSDLERAANVLGWDQQTYMPPGGSEVRGHQLGTLQSVAHRKFVSDEVGELLDNLSSHAESLDPDSDDARLIKVTKRIFDKKRKVPADYVGEFSRVTSRAHNAWEKAREEDDFSQFQPHLEKIVDMRRQYADFFAPYDHVYDPLLDNYEPGMKTETVQRIFEEIRPLQVDLIQAVGEQPQVDDDFLHQSFDEKKQWDFGVEVITDFGYDWNRGRQDKATHPFTTHFGVGDVRITTRIDPNFLNSGLFSTLHESGHAIYEQGVAEELERSPLGEGASLAVHESQSRMYENLIGRSYPFWSHYYPRLKEIFPSQLGNVDLDTFYKGINKVEPSLIRVEADEATYNLHIMLRLELEIALMEKEIEVEMLPEAWNARMEEYLGITPSNDREGVLQDVHWSSGYIGYFSTYALGNLISVQLWDKIEEDLPGLVDDIRAGKFAALLSWLRDHVHRHGHKFVPQEVVKRATGSRIDPEPYMQYLKSKYTEIYGL